MDVDFSSVIAAAGWLGAVCTVLAYGLLSAGKLASGSYGFQGLNILGAVLLCLSAFSLNAWSSAAVNIVWVVIGIQTCVMMVNARRTARAKVGAAMSHDGADVFSMPTKGEYADVPVTLVMPVISQDELERDAERREWALAAS